MKKQRSKKSKNTPDLDESDDYGTPTDAEYLTWREFSTFVLPDKEQEKNGKEKDHNMEDKAKEDEEDEEAKKDKEGHHFKRGEM